ncbi:MAG: cobalamin B12-binding domain-containing protein [Anaerovoracaceae bacterium]|jgi:corrinoid protein of di/trimethylamine methyltransferase
MSNLYEEMMNSVLEGEEDEAVALAQRAVEEELDLEKVMYEGFLKGIQEAGRLYESGEYYLPELVCSADALKAALAVLDNKLKSNPEITSGEGKVVLATVQGDVHDIGKTIVGSMLTAAGFELYDLGADVPNEEVIKAVKELEPDILGLSALLTTTMEEQRNIIEMLSAEKLRDRVKVIVGGAPVNQSWADKIGADGYSENALTAVKLAKGLVAKNSAGTQ